MKKLVNAGIFILLVAFFCQCKTKKNQGQKAEKEKKDWVWLFDGSSTKDWEGAGKDVFPAAGWLVKDSELIVLGKSKGQHAGAGYYYKKEVRKF